MLSIFFWVHNALRRIVAKGIRRLRGGSERVGAGLVVGHGHAGAGRSGGGRCIGLLGRLTVHLPDMRNEN